MCSPCAADCSAPTRNASVVRPAIPMRDRELPFLPSHCGTEARLEGLAGHIRSTVASSEHRLELFVVHEDSRSARRPSDRRQSSLTMVPVPMFRAMVQPFGLSITTLKISLPSTVLSALTSTVTV